MLNTKEIAPINPVRLHALMKTLKSNMSEAYKVQVDCGKKDLERRGKKRKIYHH